MTKARDLANGGFGLVLIKPSSVVNGTDNGKGTVSFSAASSVSLNDVFSTTYENYHVVLNFNASAAQSLISLRFRVSGSDNSNNDYYRAAISKDSSLSTINNENADPTTSYRIGTTGNNNALVSLNISSPFQTAQTTIVNNGVGINNTNEASWFVGGGGFGSTTSFTGFSLFPSSGTITGTVSVYGYNK